MIVLSLLCLLLVLAPGLEAATITMSPSQNFSSVLNSASCGDTIVLQNGTYSCGSNCIRIDGRQCTAATGYLTVKAQNERQAYIAHDGTGSGGGAGVYVTNSSYIWIEGLRGSTQDVGPCCNATNPFAALNVDHFVFRRNLAHNNNRYGNSHLADFQQVNNSLIEENELYWFHRHGFLLAESNNNTIRRNYCNSRQYPNVSGGFSDGSADNVRGDACFSIYPGHDNIIENSISENNDHLTEINANGLGPTERNTILGSISYKDNEGAVPNSRCRYDAGGQNCDLPWDPDLQPLSSHFKDFVVIGGIFRGLRSLGSFDTRCDNCTIVESPRNGIDIIESASTDIARYQAQGRGTPSAFGMNTIVANNGGYGIFWQFNEVGLFEFVDGFNNGSGNFQPNDSRFANTRTDNPGLGTCYLWVPDNSPMKRAGKNGVDDIGANVLYAYENGVLTNKRLWDDTGTFLGCGQVVNGVNDNALDSCINVKNRFNVNTNGCAFPSGYGSAPPPPPPSTVTLSVSPTNTQPGGTVNATWANISSPTIRDWIGIYTPGAANTAFLGWRYTNGAANGTLPVSIPSSLASGTYELRLFSNDSTTALLATSGTFTVTATPSGNWTLSAIDVTTVAPSGYSLDEIWHGLGVDSSGRIYVAISSRYTLPGGKPGDTLIFRYNPSTNGVEYLASLMDVAASFNNLISGERIAKVHADILEYNGKMYILTHDFHGDAADNGIPARGMHVMSYDLTTNAWSDLSRFDTNGITAPGQGLLGFDISRSHNKIFGITYPDGNLVVFDLATNHSTMYNPTTPFTAISRRVWATSLGNGYFTYYNGAGTATVWRLNLATGAITDTGQVVQDGVLQGVQHTSDGFTYLKDDEGRLYRWNDATEQITNLGFSKADGTIADRLDSTLSINREQTVLFSLPVTTSDPTLHQFTIATGVKSIAQTFTGTTLDEVSGGPTDLQNNLYYGEHNFQQNGARLIKLTSPNPPVSSGPPKSPTNFRITSTIP